MGKLITTGRQFSSYRKFIHNDIQEVWNANCTSEASLTILTAFSDTGNLSKIRPSAVDMLNNSMSHDWRESYHDLQFPYLLRLSKKIIEYISVFVVAKIKKGSIVNHALLL